MLPDQQKSFHTPDNEEKLSGSIGNASNPNPHEELQPANDNQLLDEKADKYLREVASIEDLPDAEDQQDMEQAIQENNERQ